jgi:hypothetical protein
MSAEYGHLTPTQLVPRLADEGRYLASESTMYRLRRRVGLSARRPLIARTAKTRATVVHHTVRSEPGLELGHHGVESLLAPHRLPSRCKAPRMTARTS